MNIEKLKSAEAAFLDRYPGGFEHPDMVEMGKKHKMDKMVAFTQESFARENFQMPDLIVDCMIKVVSRSSMVSVFEKPKFRDYVNLLPLAGKQELAEGLWTLLYSDEQRGFERLLAVLLDGKLAKWTLMTVCPAYFRPDTDVFVKPTTAKGVIQTFELEGLEYKPRPSWEFYSHYRDVINEMKTHVDPGLSPSNAAFSGFLMMTLDGWGL
jgi:hypothetical protein